MNYHFYIESTNQTIKGLKEYSALEIENSLSGEFSELFSDLCGEIPAHNKIEGESFCNDDIKQVYDVIDEKYKEELVVVYDDNEKEVARYLLTEIFKSLAENYIGSESGDIQICSIWTSQLQNFIDASKWHIALQSGNDNKIDPRSWPIPEIEGSDIYWTEDGKFYKPIMWFGVSDTEILDSWTLTDEGIYALVPEEEGMGSYGRQMNIDGFEINYGSLFDGNGSWYFGACGESGADFEKVIESCPVDLLSIYENENGMEVLSLYCLKLQGFANEKKCGQVQF